ncbi:MAG: protein-S-isoprenylcysteine methyltransferase [Sphingomonadales bacterium]|nr:protein-S-isoprenylcysteine methyltransferase [Sphingomonadales bacterium]MDE2169211.1 protein-S-isoprenylcysteine methyltransferase [Sphingomonadales bacterium]
MSSIAIEEDAALRRPASDVSGMVGWLGLAGLALWVMICRNWALVAGTLGIPGPREPMSGPYAALLGLVACGLPMVIWSLGVEKVHRHASTGLDWHAPRPWRAGLATGGVKLLGLWATWAVIGAFYVLERGYWQGSYLFAIRLLGAALVPLALLSVPYVLWLERVLVERRDGAWHCGAMLLGRPGWEAQKVAHHARVWAVKGFFTAFMLSILPGGFHDLVLWQDFDGPVAISGGLITALFVVDAQIGTLGYLLTLRPLDAHIRSANPLIEGWLAALICYPPFTLMATGNVLDYHPATSDWTHWLADYPLLLWIWAVWLVFLVAIYAWATMAFGPRFSNLTYRGVLTHGPYRFTRHPAYLSKNIFWWSSTLPFFATTHLWSDMVRNTVLLAGVSAVYWWRGITEARHLAAEDAKYRAYARWAQRHAPITRALVAFQTWLWR